MENQIIEQPGRLADEGKKSNGISHPISENGKQDVPGKIKVSSFDLFQDRVNIVNGSRTYYAYFEMIPSIKSIQSINRKKAIAWVETSLAEKIVRKHVNEEYSIAKKEMNVEAVIYIMKNRILVKIEANAAMVYFTEESEQEAQQIFDGFKSFSRRGASESYIRLVVQDHGELNLEWIYNKKPKISLTENYNDDLLLIHKKVVKELKGKGKNGLILFHGKPGTGKSTYLRHLIHLMRDKSVIVLSPKLAQSLDSPALAKLLVQNANSILIIEDAEDLITSRGRGNDSSISMLLNLTDGILGESLGIHVICTFNTALTNIDKALLRKGRLIALYEFNELAKQKAQKLSDRLGCKTQIETDMTLAEIYHQNDMDFSVKKAEKIGFKFS